MTTSTAKRPWALLLAAALALGCLLGGCSASGADGATELADTAPTEEQPPAEATGAEDAEEPDEPATEAAPTPEAPPAADDGQGGAEASGDPSPAPASATSGGVLSFRDVPAYSGSPYVYVNDGEPTFTDEERAASAGTEVYGELDERGRCSAAFAVVGTETMPTEERGSIGEVKPTGWQIAKYDFVDGKYLYNRCHLLGFQLTGENANTRNLITGTRYMNVDGMLPFENAVADYVHATGNHVLMRVAPVFEGSELVARGVHMMAQSVEDEGEGVSFNVFVYNVQPGVVIDYGTGASKLAEDATPLPDVSGSSGGGAGETSEKGAAAAGGTDKGLAAYVLNTNSKKFHKPSCSSVGQMKDKNRKDVEDTRENIIDQGYDPCKRCNP